MSELPCCGFLGGLSAFLLESLFENQPGQGCVRTESFII